MGYQPLGITRKPRSRLPARPQDLEAAQRRIRSWRRLSHQEQIERNLQRLDQVVVPWSTAVRGLGPLEESGYACLFLHIPKVGGTTMAAIIFRNSGIGGAVHVNAPVLEANPGALLTHGEFPRIALGHHKLNQVVYQLINRELVHFTVLRDPLDRVVSYYNYLRSDPRHRKRTCAAGRTLAEFVRSADLCEIHNAQTLRLTGRLHSKVQQPGGNASLEDLEQAKITLSQRFTLFGVLESFDAFLIMIQRLLGWQDVFYRRQNVSQRFIRPEDVDESTRSLILDRNQADQALHDYAKKLFQERSRQLRLDDAAIEQFRERNQLYQELLGNST
jgi:hypothetical protein